jgi:histidyl-tRNA synthetase
MREANRQKARFVVILGEKELNKKMAVLRNMEIHKQEEVAIGELVRTILKNLHNYQGK